MSRGRAIGLALIFAVVMMVPFILQRGTINGLRAENKALNERVAELTRAAASGRTNAGAAAYTAPLPNVTPHTPTN